MNVLAFDLSNETAIPARVQALTRRRYFGAMIRFTCGMGRTLRVTADHPMIVWAPDGERIVRADQVEAGQRIAALTRLPQAPAPVALDLVELLQGTDLERDVLVTPTDDSFTQQYRQFARHVPAEVLRHPLEIKDHNRMRLGLYRLLREQGALDVPTSKLRLYTAKGAGAMVNAVLPVDADMARLCGYYLAEGFISRDRGREGAIRDRIGFSFHVNETSYIADVQRILASWGLKFITKTDGKSHTTLTSSRVFAWLLRDLLGCGVRSEDKCLPTFAFSLPEALRKELVRGAFSGDGAVTTLQGGKNLMFEYATVSKRLADGLALLLQSIGVVPSLRPRWMNKSKQVAHLLRVSGYEQLLALQDVCGDKHRDRITSILGGYQRHIRQSGFERRNDVALLSVVKVEREETVAPVYSLETATGTVIAASGLVCHNCFPKDTRALYFLSKEHGCPSILMEAVDRINEAQKRVLAEKVRRHYGPSLSGKTLAIWGLAFKPRTDDVREAPALVLLRELLAGNVRLNVHDPEAMPNVRREFGNALTYFDRPYGALEDADGLVIVTEWQQFRTPDFVVMKHLLNEPVIFDGRNLYEPSVVAEAGFTYHSIGRQTAKPSGK